MAKQAHTQQDDRQTQQTQQSFSMKMKMRRQLKLFTCLASSTSHNFRRRRCRCRLRLRLARTPNYHTNCLLSDAKDEINISHNTAAKTAAAIRTASAFPSALLPALILRALVSPEQPSARTTCDCEAATAKDICVMRDPA